jgi:hypothetical protein
MARLSACGYLASMGTLQSTTAGKPQNYSIAIVSSTDAMRALSYTGNTGMPIFSKNTLRGTPGLSIRRNPSKAEAYFPVFLVCKRGHRVRFFWGTRKLQASACCLSLGWIAHVLVGNHLGKLDATGTSKVAGRHLDLVH